MDLAEEIDAENARQGGNPYEHQGTQLGLDYPNSPQDQLGWKMSALNRNLDKAGNLGRKYMEDRKKEDLLNRKLNISPNTF